MTRFDQSIIWSLLHRFYAEAGPEAWSHKIVPQRSTSNAFCADTYAAIVATFFKELAAEGNSKPLLVIELGGGSGGAMQSQRHKDINFSCSLFSLPGKNRWGDLTLKRTRETGAALLTDFNPFDAHELIDLIESSPGICRSGKLELDFGDGYAAERYLDEWRSLAGTSPEWVTLRARSLILQGKSRSAQDFLEQAEPTEAEGAARAWLTVWAAMEQGDNDRAQEEVMTALARYPRSPDLNARAGRLLAMQGNREAASEYVAAALAADPSITRRCFCRARAGSRRVIWKGPWHPMAWPPEPIPILPCHPPMLSGC